MTEPRDTSAEGDADSLVDAAERTRSNTLLAHSDYVVPIAMREVARQIPDRIAIESGARRITFAELESRANRLAHALLDRDLDRDTPVLILCDHGVDPPVAICGVLHAGLIAAPVDVKEPADRLHRVFQASGAEWVVTTAPTPVLRTRSPTAWSCSARSNAPPTRRPMSRSPTSTRA
jgi:acyl-CoA synthetase (AMP-forming)/AMP-acid ligase II